MTKYHPDIRFISDYATGSLSLSQAFCVSTHLHYCDECKVKVEQLSNLGAVLFENIAPRTLEQGFASLMHRIDSMPEDNIQVKSEALATMKKTSSLPPTLNKLTGNDLDSINWQRIGKNFCYSELNIGDSHRVTSLFNIKAGGYVPEHNHEGNEITVVLKGSFSDQDDHYQQGDFIVRTAGEIHTPVAGQDEDCLCLSSLDAPIQMTNWFYRFFMPIVG